ncbi:MAG: hypothetical protein HY094_10370 [Candidatus Melainabacteria bacterium]|nr:hypothetical protein [Candidatus Melainabacteria bacterium]
MQLSIKKIFFRSLLISFVLLFYFWTATGGYNYFDFKSDHNNRYNDLAQSFLAGKLHLLYKPRPELLSLSNPYDPSINGAYRVHDASLYKEKYYLYFGPTPVLTTYIPYRLIMQHGMHDNLAIFIFSIGALIWAILLLFYLKKKYFNKIPEWIMLLTIAVIAFANATPILMRRPQIYEVAISSGLFFLMGAIYFFITAFSKEEPSKSRLFFGSFFLGLAVGGRPQIALCCILFPIIWFKLCKVSNKKWGSTLIAILASLLPFMLCLIGLLLYNYFRFDSIFEFGTKYQLAGKPMTVVKLFDPARIPISLYLNVFQPPFLNLFFPFAHLKSSIPSYIVNPPYYDYGQIAGAIPGIPFVILLFLLPIVLILQKVFNKKYLSEKKSFPYYEFLLLLIPAVLNISILLFMPGTVMRYTADYATFLILLAAIAWFYIYSNSAYASTSKLFFNTIAVLFSSICNVIYRIAFCIESKEHKKTERLSKPNLSKSLTFNDLGTASEKTHFVPGKLFFNTIAVFFSIYSIFFGIAFSIESPEATLRGQNTPVYNEVIAWFKPILFLDHGNWDLIRERISPSSFTVTCTNIFSPQYDINNIIDGRLDTDWAPIGSKPVFVTVTPANPSTIKSLWLLSRSTHLFETWEKLVAILYIGNKPISVQTFEFPNAYKHRIQNAKFQPVLADKIELIFHNPVTRNQKGKELDPTKLYPGSPADFCPGYTEIAIEWQ